jgi:hypothetical protein
MRLVVPCSGMAVLRGVEENQKLVTCSAGRARE